MPLRLYPRICDPPFGPSIPSSHRLRLPCGQRFAMSRWSTPRQIAPPFTMCSCGAACLCFSARRSQRSLARGMSDVCRSAAISSLDSRLCSAQASSNRVAVRDLGIFQGDRGLERVRCSARFREHRLVPVLCRSLRVRLLGVREQVLGAKRRNPWQALFLELVLGRVLAWEDRLGRTLRLIRHLP